MVQCARSSGMPKTITGRVTTGCASVPFTGIHSAILPGGRRSGGHQKRPTRWVASQHHPHSLPPPPLHDLNFTSADTTTHLPQQIPKCIAHGY